MAQWVNFLLLLGITNIIGINSLIAIIGDSYEKVQSDRGFYESIYKFDLLSELNDFYLFLYRNRRREANFVYVHIIRYDDSSVSKKEWKGRIQSMKDHVLDNSNALKAEVKQEIAQVRGDISEMKEQLSMIMKIISNKN